MNLRKVSLGLSALMVLLLVLLTLGLAQSEQEYGEAPMLQQKVKAGELPPVEERLPANPLVIEPVEEVGQYGGELYTVAQSLDGFGTDLHFIGFEPPLALNPDGSVGPNVVKSWEVSPDARIWTLHLRRGIKWSDGVPFDADDVLFWWQDEVQNKKITDVIYIQAFKGMKLEKIDEYTIRIELAKSMPMFKYTLAKQWGYLGKWWRPKHYLKQFNPNYVDEDKLLKRAKKEGYDTIADFYLAKAGWSAKPVNPECPTLTAYKLVEKTTDHWVWERNPYYWKVDTAGNQLPYIDRVLVRKVEDIELINQQIVSGALDLAVWNTSLENYPLYKENAKKGKYRVLLWPDTRAAEVKIMPNLTVEDPILRDIFHDVRFRQALSLAINREEINQTLFFGKATPRQFTLHPSSKYFEPEWAESYAEYDPQRANQLLDDMGLDERDAAGYRLRPDGQRLTITIEYWPGEVAAKTPILELVKEYWGKIGIKVALKPQNRSLNAQRADANKIQMNIWHGGAAYDGQWEITGLPPVPCSGCVDWGSEYARWWDTEGEEGIEPPEKVKHLFELRDKLLTTVDEEERLRIGKEMWQMQADNLWTIGTVGMAPHPIIVRENLRNVPESGRWGVPLLWLHPYHPEQFFFAAEK